MTVTPSIIDAYKQISVDQPFMKDFQVSMLKPYTPLYSSKTSKDMVMVLCSSCAKQVPKVNIELHKLKCTAVDVTSISKSKKKPSKVSYNVRNKS